jgi:hypothetical protein
MDDEPLVADAELEAQDDEAGIEDDLGDGAGRGGR